MPEGPEIRLAADELAAALAGRVTTDVRFGLARLRRHRKRLCGARVCAVEARGKAILTRFENDLVIYSHNQLYGRWYVTRAGELPNTGRQLRVAIHNPEFSALLYSASEIDVLERDQLEHHKFLSRLGPDILGDEPSPDDIVARLRSPAFARRQFAGLMLDQGFLAGLGNYLRAEILTLARLHPLDRPCDCSARELRRLANNILAVTRRSYRTRGVVNPPRLVRHLQAAGMTRREQYRFNTYGRAGENCHYCGSRIRCSNAGGRKMYFCPGCQPRARR